MKIPMIFLFECVYGVIRWSCGVEETIRFCTDGAQFICRLNGGRRDDGDKRQDFKLNVFHCRRPEFATKKITRTKRKVSEFGRNLNWVKRFWVRERQI